MDLAILTYPDGSRKELAIRQEANTLRIAGTVDGAEKVVIQPEMFRAEAGEDGYFLMPNIVDRSTAGGLIRFRERPDEEQLFEDFRIPGFGVKKGDHAFFAVVTGGTFDFKVHIRL